jgi:hypothetical protein
VAGVHAIEPVAEIIGRFEEALREARLP